MRPPEERVTWTDLAVLAAAIIAIVVVYLALPSPPPGERRPRCRGRSPTPPAPAWPSRTWWAPGRWIGRTAAARLSCWPTAPTGASGTGPNGVASGALNPDGDLEVSEASDVWAAPVCVDREMAPDEGAHRPRPGCPGSWTAEGNFALRKPKEK